MINKIIAFIISLLLLPIFLIVFLIIFFDDGFPVLYTQKRIGLNNSLFKLYKLRTMKKHTPDIPTHLLKNPKSVYTWSGPFLRKFSFDELPQLINIIKGDIVFIGPRPALHNQDDLMKLRTKAGIHKIMPGITGWAQVNGRDELSIPDKVKLDEYYLKHKSLLLNIRIFFLTILRVLGMKGVSH